MCELKHSSKVPLQFHKLCPLPYSMTSLVDQALDTLVQQDVIEPIMFSDWACPIVPVLKKDKKSIRICGDFSVTVNRAIELDTYPIPRIEDLFTKLSGGKSFSQVDLSQAYLQLQLEEESQKLVVVNTHRGLFKYKRLPYGISSAPGIFQRAIESLLHDIPFVVVYLDDILITGTTDEEHLDTLDKVLHRLESHGLKLNKDKCTFLSPSVIYLRHRNDQNGLHPSDDNVRAVKDAPRLTNVNQLTAYLGVLTYYSKFLPNLVSTLVPLYSLLRSFTRW